MEFSRQEQWSGLLFPSPGYLPNTGMEPMFLALSADSLLSEPLTREALTDNKCCLNGVHGLLFSDFHGSQDLLSLGEIRQLFIHIFLPVETLSPTNAPEQTKHPIFLLSPPSYPAIVLLVKLSSPSMGVLRKTRWQDVSAASGIPGLCCW